MWQSNDCDVYFYILTLAVCSSVKNVQWNSTVHILGLKLLFLMIKNGIEIRMGQISFCYTQVLNLLLMNCNSLNQHWVYSVNIWVYFIRVINICWKAVLVKPLKAGGDTKEGNSRSVCSAHQWGPYLNKEEIRFKDQTQRCMILLECVCISRLAIR